MRRVGGVQDKAQAKFAICQVKINPLGMARECLLKENDGQVTFLYKELMDRKLVWTKKKLLA